MPLTKAQKALYEAALRRKGLQPGKAVRQDPRTFVGPIQMGRGSRPNRHPKYTTRYGGYMTEYDDVMVPSRTYWRGRGRLQDLEDELQDAIEDGVWERKNPLVSTYYRYYNDGDIPTGIRDDWEGPGLNYNSPRYSYVYDRYSSKYPDGSGTKYRGKKRALSRLGELELEARADEMIENDYKDYLKKMYQRFPNRAAVLEQFPEYNGSPYLEELFPE